MTPELPKQIMVGSAFASIGWPDLECSMLRNGVRCCNRTDGAIISPTAIGYEVLAFCQDCFDVLPTDWKNEFEQHITGSVFDDH